VRVVVDSNVMVAALRSRFGASRLLLIGALNGRFSLVVSVPLMLEYEAVMKRPNHLAAAGASISQIDTILDNLAAIGIPAQLNFSWRPMLSDPSDEMVLETAVNGFADLLVTFNIRHFGWAPGLFGIVTASPPAARILLGL
jgi:putative PIN family toxin of toxin-antitoxin system